MLYPSCDNIKLSINSKSYLKFYIFNQFEMWKLVLDKCNTWQFFLDMPHNYVDNNILNHYLVSYESSVDFALWFSWKIFFSSADPKGQVRYFQHLASVIILIFILIVCMVIIHKINILIFLFTDSGPIGTKN